MPPPPRRPPSATARRLYPYAVRLPDGRTSSCVAGEHVPDHVIATGPADAARASLVLRRYALMHEGVALRLEQAARNPELVVAPSERGGPPVLQLLGSGVPASTCPEGPFDVLYPATDLERDWPCEPGDTHDSARVEAHGRLLVERTIALAQAERAAAQEHRERAARLVADPSARGRWRVEQWHRTGMFTRQLVAQTSERALLEGRAAVLLPVTRTPLEQGVHAESTSA